MAAKTKVKKQVHIHSFERIRGEKNMYKCTNPTCFYTNTKARLEGKQALCAYCPTIFKLTADALRLKKPHCPKCKPENNFRASKPMVPTAEVLQPIVADIDDLVSKLERMPEL